MGSVAKTLIHRRFEPGTGLVLYAAANLQFASRPGHGPSLIQSPSQLSSKLASRNRFVLIRKMYLLVDRLAWARISGVPRTEARHYVPWCGMLLGEETHTCLRY